MIVQTVIILSQALKDRRLVGRSSAHCTWIVLTTSPRIQVYLMGGGGNHSSDMLWIGDGRGMCYAQTKISITCIWLYEDITTMSDLAHSKSSTPPSSRPFDMPRVNNRSFIDAYLTWIPIVDFIFSAVTELNNCMYQVGFKISTWSLYL